MIELINDISQIMKKYGREYKIKIDPITVKVYIPISELLGLYPLKGASCIIKNVDVEN